MWSERFVDHRAVARSASSLPSAWHAYTPTLVDLGILAGTIGFFTLLFMLFLRFVPFIPAYEVKELAAELRDEQRRDAVEEPG